MNKTELMTEIGKRIRKYREKRNFTQEDFAYFVEIDRGMYGNIERGKRNITIYTLARIAKGLNVSIDKLFPPTKDL